MEDSGYTTIESSIVNNKTNLARYITFRTHYMRITVPTVKYILTLPITLLHDKKFCTCYIVYLDDCNI